MAEVGRPISEIIIRCMIECKQTTKGLQNLQEEQKKTIKIGDQLKDNHRKIQDSVFQTAKSLEELKSSLREVTQVPEFRPKVNINEIVKELERLMGYEINLEKKVGDLKKKFAEKMEIKDIKGAESVKKQLIKIEEELYNVRKTRTSLINELKGSMPGIIIPTHVETKESYLEVQALVKRLYQLRNKQKEVMEEWLKSSKEGATATAKNYKKQFDLLTSEVEKTRNLIQQLSGISVTTKYDIAPVRGTIEEALLKQINIAQQKLKDLFKAEMPPKELQIFPKIFKKLTSEEIIEKVPIVKTKAELTQEITRVLKEDIKAPEKAIQEIIRKVVKEPEEIPRTATIVVDLNEELVKRGLEPLTAVQASKLEFDLMPTGLSELEQAISIIKDSQKSHERTIEKVEKAGIAQTEYGKGVIHWEQKVIDQYQTVLNLLGKFPKYILGTGIMEEAKELIAYLEQIKATIRTIPTIEEVKAPDILKDVPKEQLVRCKVICDEATKKIKELTSTKISKVVYEAEVPPHVRVEPLTILVKYVQEKLPEVKIPDAIQKIVSEYEGEMPPETYEAILDFALGKIPEVPPAVQSLMYKYRPLEEPELKELSQFIELVHKEVPTVKLEPYLIDVEYARIAPPKLDPIRQDIKVMEAKIPDFEVPPAVREILHKEEPIPIQELEPLIRWIKPQYEKVEDLKLPPLLRDIKIVEQEIPKPEIEAAEIPIQCKLICMETTKEALDKVTGKREIEISLPHAPVRTFANRMSSDVGAISTGLSGLSRSIGSSFQLMSDRAERFRATQLRWIGRDLMRIGFMITIYGRMFSTTFQKAATASADLEGALMDIGDVLEDMADIIGTTIAPIFEALRGPLEAIQDFLEMNEIIAAVIGVVILIGSAFVLLASQMFSVIGTITVLRYGLVQIAGSALGAKTEVRGLTDMLKLLFEVLMGATRVQRTMVQELGLSQEETKKFALGIDDTIMKLEAFLGSEQALMKAGFKPVQKLLDGQEQTFKLFGDTASKVGEEVAKSYPGILPVFNRIVNASESLYQEWQEGKEYSKKLIDNIKELVEVKDELSKTTDTATKKELKGRIASLEQNIKYATSYNTLQSAIVRTTEDGRRFQKNALKNIQKEFKGVLSIIEENAEGLNLFGRFIKNTIKEIIHAIDIYKEENDLIDRNEKLMTSLKTRIKSVTGVMKLLGRAAIGVIGGFILMAAIEPVIEGIQGPLEVIGDIFSNIIDTLQPAIDAFADVLELIGEIPFFGPILQAAIGMFLLALALIPGTVLKGIAAFLKFLLHIDAGKQKSDEFRNILKTTFLEFKEGITTTIPFMQVLTNEFSLLESKIKTVAIKLKEVTAGVEGTVKDAPLDVAWEFSVMAGGTEVAKKSLEQITGAMDTTMNTANQMVSSVKKINTSMEPKNISSSAYAYNILSKNVRVAGGTLEDTSVHVKTTVENAKAMTDGLKGSSDEMGKVKSGVSGAVKGLKNFASGAFKGFAYLTLFGIALQALEPILEPLAEAFQMMFEPLEPIFELIGDWIEENPELVQGLFLIIAGLWAANKILGPFGGLLGGISKITGKVTGGIGDATDSVSGFSFESAASMAGMAAVIASIAGLVLAFAELARSFKESGISIDQFAELILIVSVAGGALIAEVTLLSKSFKQFSYESAVSMAAIGAVLAGLAGLVIGFSNFVKAVGESGVKIGDTINLIVSFSISLGILVGIIEVLAAVMGRLGATWETALSLAAVTAIIVGLSLLVGSFGDLIKAASESGFTLGEITGFLNATITSVGILIGVLAAVAGVLSAVTGGLAAAGIAALGFLVIAFAELIKAVAVFIEAIVYMAKNWKKISKMLLEIGPTIVKAIENTVDEVLRVLKDKVPEWIRMFGEAMRRIREAIIAEGPSIANAIKDIMSELGRIIGSALAGIPLLFSNMFAEIFRGIGEAVNILTTAFGEMSNKIVTSFSEMFISIFKTIDEQIPLVVQAFTSMTSDILNAVGSGIESIVTDFGTLIGRIMSVIGEQVYQLIDLGSDIISNILEGIGDAAEQIGDAFIGTMEKIGSTIGSVVSVGADIIADILEGIGDAAVVIGNAFIDTISEIGDVIGSAIDVGGDIIADIITGIGDNIYKIGNATKDVIKKVGEVITDNIDTITQYGTDIAEAIKDGITAGVDVVKGGIGEIIDHIISGCPGGGLQDMSKVGYKYGNQMSRGMADGMLGSLKHIKDSVSQAISGSIEIIEGGIKIVGDIATGIGTAVVIGIAGAASAAGSAVEGLGNIISDGIEGILTGLRNIFCFSHIIPEAILDAVDPSVKAMSILGDSISSTLGGSIRDVSKVSEDISSAALSELKNMEELIGNPEIQITSRIGEMIGPGMLTIPTGAAVAPSPTYYNDFYITISARELSPQMTDAEKRNLADDLSKLVAEKIRRT